MTAHRLGLVGSGIDMSLAPAFHLMAGKLVGIEVSYELIPVDPPTIAPTFDAIIRRLVTEGYHGVNVTVPFKAAAARAAAEGSAEVTATGVANTLLLGADGPTHAHNTDMSGFAWAFRRRFGDESPGTVAVLGAGGVGSATAAALVDLGAIGLRLYDLVPDRSRALAALLRQRDHGVQVDVAPSAEAAVEGVDGLVNGTPMGMSWSPGSPLDLRAVGTQRWVFDAVYSPIETPLMVRASELGLDRITGFDLFLGQAIDAFEIFTGHQLDARLVRELETNIGILERERGV